MGKGDYSGPKYGGSRSGWKKDITMLKMKVFGILY
jgi:hypothetical protein